MIRVVAGLGAAVILGSLGIRWGWLPGLGAAGLAVITGAHGLHRLRRPSRSPVLPLYLDATTIGAGLTVTQAPLPLAGLLMAAVVLPGIVLLPRRRLWPFLAFVAAWAAARAAPIGASPLTPSQVATLSGAFVALFVPVVAGLLVVNAQLYRQLRASERRFRALVQNSSDVIAVLAPDATIRYLSPAAERLWGHHPDDLVGRKGTELLHPDDVRPVVAAYARRTRDPIEMRIRHREGSWRHAEAVVSDLLADPTVQGWVVNLRDVTDRKEAERRMEELVRSKDEFIASVSHELRTPLTGVLGFAQELRDAWHGFSPEEAAQLAGLVAVQAQEVSFIVEDLLVAARSDIGTVEVVAEPVDLAAEVEAVLEAWQGWDVTTTGDPVRARADTMRVRQIVRNLVANAVRYGGENVEVAIGSDGDGICFLEVTDDGPEIAPEHRARMFDPYRRGHQVPGQPSSVGLGLSVSRQLARLMGGDLEYRYEDGRSVFRLTLPAWRVRSLR